MVGRLTDLYVAELGHLITEVCHKCRTPFAMERSVYDTMSRLKEGGGFHCPLGHQQHYVSGETETDKMRRERDRAIQNAAYLQDRLNEEQAAKQSTERSLAATRGQITKIKNRVGRGVCPCCNRTFENLHRHMASKHANFSQEVAA
jgi:hypothetical protein